jgi:hypothetical protein
MTSRTSLAESFPPALFLPLHGITSGSAGPCSQSQDDLHACSAVHEHLDATDPCLSVNTVSDRTIRQIFNTQVLDKLLHEGAISCSAAIWLLGTISPPEFLSLHPTSSQACYLLAIRRARTGPSTAVPPSPGKYLPQRVMSAYTIISKPTTRRIRRPA